MPCISFVCSAGTINVVCSLLRRLSLPFVSVMLTGPWRRYTADSTQAPPSCLAPEPRGEEARDAATPRNITLHRTVQRAKAGLREMKAKQRPWWWWIANPTHSGLALQDEPLAFAGVYAAGINFVYQLHAMGCGPGALRVAAVLAVLAFWHLNYSFFFLFKAPCHSDLLPAAVRRRHVSLL